MDDLLAEFLTETNESLAELDVALLKLERTPDDRETLSQIFRLVHTIKGTCGFLGLPRLERVAHAGESVLGRVRDGELAVTPDIVSLILRALDRIKSIVTGLGDTGAEPRGDDAPLIAALDEVAEGRAVEAAPKSAPTPAAPEAREPDLAHPPQETPPTAAEPVAQTIRVVVDVLEDLMTLVSELVLTRNQLLQLARTQEDSAFTVPLRRLSQITSDLQEGVMKTRMQPIGNAWNKLPRLVRDLARDLDKKLELTMHGQETELDRQVLELIKDPLTHMVRNSGDHGLELPAERRAAGKPETGRISLKAYHEGGHIIIEIADDGRGLAVERIRAKAIANGLATEAELAGMSEGQIQRFIFRAGFSTAAEVTAVSGRGVGMDVVKTNIERIGGTIDLKSVAGAGSTFTIKIPLTLAIVSALIVEVGGERFAIPQLSVVELVRAGGGSGAVIERINATPVLRLRDRLLPLVNLSELLRLRPAAETADAGAYIVVAQVGATMLGIMVDQVFDTEEIVVRPVAPILRHLTMFSGNTILGDGSVIMILDPNGIARATAIGGGEHRAATPAATGAHRTEDRTAVLIFCAGGQPPLAVPLGLVARLENIPRERIEASGGALVTQYRGRLMPLVPVSGTVDEQRERHPVLVFADGGRSMGLLVDEIVDVVEQRLDIELSAARPGLLGSAVVAGHATDVIDTAYWLSLAWRDWFGGRPGTSARRRILLVDDSDFLRQLLVPWLSAAGHQVTAVASAAAALKLRDAGAAFDAIVSDIEMPDMDGLAFARAVRGDGPWSGLPMLALSAHEEPREMEAARVAGFTGFVGKSDREALTAALRRCAAEPVHA